MVQLLRMRSNSLSGSVLDAVQIAIQGRKRSGLASVAPSARPTLVHPENAFAAVARNGAVVSADSPRSRLALLDKHPIQRRL